LKIPLTGAGSTCPKPLPNGRLDALSGGSGWLDPGAVPPYRPAPSKIGSGAGAGAPTSPSH
jgi:hypothetical protein